MSVTASDIVFYASQNMPENDTDTSGGAINSGIRITFDDIVATDQIEIVSDNASDTNNITIYGRNAAGSIINETVGMSGTTVVTTSNTYERVLKATLDAAAVGTVTVRDQDTDTAIGTIAATESGFRRPFYDATANASGGSDKDLYEQIFLKNNNASNALLSAQVTEVASGLYTKVEFAVADGHQYDESVSNRLSAPTGTGPFGSGASGVPDTDLGTLDWVGIWLHLDLNAGDAAQNSYYQLQVDGSTT